MKRLCKILMSRPISLALLLIASYSSHAINQHQHQKLSANQETFLAAEKALKEDKLNQYRQLKQQLSHYSLVSYLDYAELSKALTPNNRKAIDNFIKLQQNSPLSSRMRSNYIGALAADKHYGLFSHYFAPLYNKSKSAKLKCLYLRHQLAVGVSPAKIWPKVDPLWNVPKSQPEACDPLFERWRNAGRLNHKIAYQRFYQAAQQAPISLVKYLQKFLPKKQQYLADLWIKVRKNPNVISKMRFFPKKNLNWEAPIAAFAMKKLAWDDRDSAYKTWRKLQRNLPMPRATEDEIERTLFLALATENNPKSLPWAKRKIGNYLNDKLLTQWKLATFLRAEQWPLIVQLYQLLPSEVQHTGQWQYWFAVASEQTGNQETAKSVLTSLAKERDYYGFKAATRLNQALQLNHQPSNINPETLSLVGKMSNVERARELLALGRTLEANREWRSLLRRLKGSEQIKAAAKIAHDWGWYNQGILTVARAKEWDDTELRFPTAFKHDYIVMGKKVGLPAEWLMGVTRQESAYGSTAVSGAGAYGLMQVMPATAKIYSKKFSIPYKGRNDLFNPDTNIEMGSHYLKLRFDELDNNPIYASAAYNAGKHRIEKWKDFGRFPTEIWIESIPYTETRDYIKKVMTYRAIYAMKLNKKDTVFDYILTTDTGGQYANCPANALGVC